MLDLAFNLLLLMAAHKQRVGFMSEGKDLNISFFNGRLGFEGDGSSYTGFAYRIDRNDGYVPFPTLSPTSPEPCVESGCDLSLTFQVFARGSVAST